jgi:hypothetical protein
MSYSTSSVIGLSSDVTEVSIPVPRKVHAPHNRRSQFDPKLIQSVYTLAIQLYIRLHPNTVCTAQPLLFGRQVPPRYLGTFWLPLLRFFRTFSSVARQTPGYNWQRCGTAGTSKFTSKYFPCNRYVSMLRPLYSVYCLCENVYCTVLYFTVLYCTILYCTELYSNVQ